MDRKFVKKCANCAYFLEKVNAHGWLNNYCVSLKAHKGKTLYDIGRKVKPCKYYEMNNILYFLRIVNDIE